jgi:hypothetical protein
MTALCRASTARLVEALRALPTPSAPKIDERSVSDLLDVMDEELVLSVLSIIKDGRPYEAAVLRGRIVGLSRRNSIHSPKERIRRKSEMGIKPDQELKLRRAVAATLTYRDFCDPKHQTQYWLQEYLNELESDFRENKISDAHATEFAAAYAFVQCLDFNTVPDVQTAEWITLHLDALRPHAEMLRERGDWSRGFLEEVVNAKAFALVDGIL